MASWRGGLSSASPPPTSKRLMLLLFSLLAGVVLMLLFSSWTHVQQRFLMSSSTNREWGERSRKGGGGGAGFVVVPGVGTVRTGGGGIKNQQQHHQQLVVTQIEIGGQDQQDENHLLAQHQGLEDGAKHKEEIVVADAAQEKVLILDGGETGNNKNNTHLEHSERKEDEHLAAKRSEQSQVSKSRVRFFDGIPEISPEFGNDNFKMKSFPKWDPGKALEWKARKLYLPIPEPAKQAFLRHEKKQHARKNLWSNFNTSTCLEEVPECEFFQEIGAKTMFKKCCVEHMKMKKSLFYVLDVAEKFGLRLFLDSGTLLSAIRDGGDTLVPWETDIDLGVVGQDPSLVSEPFKIDMQLGVVQKKRHDSLGEERNEEERVKLMQQMEEILVKNGGQVTQNFDSVQLRSSFLRTERQHIFQSCLQKVSKNVSRNGMCKDAHYLYYAETSKEAKIDTSRVEIWPFFVEPGEMVHPTRKKLNLPTGQLLPLSIGPRCKMWGRPIWCPKDPEWYLDHEYSPDWRWPKTIHWGEENAPAWGKNRVEGSIPPIPTKNVRVKK